jgi:hypothetical protein
MTSCKKKHQHNTKAKCRVQFLFVNSNILKCKKKVPKFNRKIVEGAKFDTPNTHIDDRSLSWLGTDTRMILLGFCMYDYYTGRYLYEFKNSSA